MDVIFYGFMIFLAVFAASLVLGTAVIWLMKGHMAHFLAEVLIHVGLSVGGKLYKKLPESWRHRLDRWFPPTPQAPLPTSNRQSLPPRRSGPAPQGGNPVAVNPNPTNPAGAGQAAAQQQSTPQNDGWPNWMSTLAPIIVTILVLAAEVGANLTPLYYTGLNAQMPNVWVMMQVIIAVLVGIIVWLIGRINALCMDILFMQTTHQQLKRPDDWTPPAAQPQAPANQQPNPNP